MTLSDQPSNRSLVLRLVAGATLFLGSFFAVRPLGQALGLVGPQQSLLMVLPALAALWFFRFDRRIETARGTASPQIERFSNRYIQCIFAHIALVIFAEFVTQSHAVPAALLALVKMLPALPLLVLNYVFARNLLEETDEFQRAQKVQASLWATGLLLTTAMVWGALEQQRLARHVAPSAAFYIWWLGMAAAKIVQKVRG